MGSELEQIKDMVVDLATRFGLKIIISLVVIFIGFKIGNAISRMMGLRLRKSQIDDTVAIYLEKALNVMFKILILLSIAGYMGLETTSFVAILGAAGLAIGLALQGSLSNFAGGVLLLIFRPFKVGDYIVAQGEEGKVTAVDIFATTLTKLDNRRIIIPNGPLVGGMITNVTAEPVRRVDVAIGISYGDDISKAQKVLLDLANS